MTLFEAVSPDDIFQEALDAFYATADGKVITPPSYCSIQAIGYDMYLCKDNDEDGVILNGKGQPTNK